MTGPAPVERELGVLRSLARRIDPSDPGAHNNLGVLYYEREMIPEAIAALTQALELDPNMKVAQDNLEIIQRETGYYDRRIGELREQIARFPGERQHRLELGRAYLTLNQHDRAAEQFEELLRGHPNDGTALVQLGLVEQARARHDVATEWFRRAAEVDPRSSVARLYLGQALYNRGLVDAALSTLIEAAQISPDHADVQYLLGFVYGDLGYHDAARVAARKAVTLNPALGSAQTNLRITSKKPADPSRGQVPAAPVAEPVPPYEAHLNLAVAFRRRGYFVEAQREYRFALETGEDEQPALEGLAELHLLRRETQSALDLYARLIANAPAEPKFWNEKGVVLHQAGRRVEAAAAYREAIRLDEGYALAWNNLGVLEAAGPDPLAAGPAFETSLAGRPEFVAARLNLALFHFQRHRMQAALDGYRAVLSTDPDHAIAWNGVGLVLMELKRYGDAKNAFGRAVEADPESAPAHYNLGFALSQLGAFDEALRETRRALELDPFYLPQKYALSIELQFKESLVPIAPSLMADVTVGSVGEDFSFDPASLDDLFAGLAPSEAPGPIAADPFSVARDLVAKGLLEQATAEVHRTMRRGGGAGPGIGLLGEIFSRRGLFGEALERFRQAKQEGADDPSVAIGEATALLALGRAEEARAAADLLVMARPTDPAPLEIRARARLAQDDLAGAQDDALGAIMLAPGRADLLVLRGVIGRRLGDTDEALDALQAAVAIDPGHVQAWYEAGLVHEERRELAEAKSAYERALAILPTYLEAGLALGELLRRQGRPVETTRLLVELLLVEPYATDALVLLGRSLADERRHRDAVVAFTRVLKFVPDHGVARFHRGVSLNAIGRFDDAMADWDLVVQQAPTGPLAAAARAEARSTRDLVHILQPAEV